MGEHALRGRPEEGRDEAAAPPGADDHLVGGLRRGHEHLGGRGVEDRPADVEVGELVAQGRHGEFVGRGRLVVELRQVLFARQPFGGEDVRGGDADDVERLAVELRLDCCLPQHRAVGVERVDAGDDLTGEVGALLRVLRGIDPGTVLRGPHRLVDRLVLIGGGTVGPRARDDDGGAVGVGGHRERDRAEQPTGEPAVSAGADDGEIGRRRAVDEDSRGVADGDDRRHGHTRLPGHLGGGLAELPGRVLDGVVEVGRVDDVSAAHVHAGHGVGGDEAQLCAGELGMVDRPVEGAAAVGGTVDSDDDRV